MGTNRLHSIATAESGQDGDDYMASVGPKLARTDNRDAATGFDINVEKRTVFVRFTKKVSVMDIRIYATRLRSHPDFDPEFSEIVDLREVKNLDLNASDFLKLADQIDCFSARAWRAFVVHDSVQHHAARMHKILRAQPNMRIFSSVQEAQEWIDSRPAESA